MGKEQSMAFDSRCDDAGDELFEDLIGEVLPLCLGPRTLESLHCRCIRELQQQSAAGGRVGRSLNWSFGGLLEPALGFVLLVLYLSWALERGLSIYGIGIVW